MQMYLPIAELSVNLYGMIALGGVAGILAGLFGIGGGFLLTPMLIFMGIPPQVAVATSANQIIASSFSGFLSHRRNQRVDLSLGNFLVFGGFVGSILGILLFRALQNLGQVDLVITILYIFFLLLISYVMFREYLQHRGSDSPPERAPERFTSLRKLPMQIFFSRSEVQHSILLPIGLGFGTGLLVTLMGIGGGFIMLPAMIYLLRMPQRLTVGTSLYHVMFTTMFATVLHAVSTQTVDVVLAALLVIGSAVGTQWGVKISQKLRTHHLRVILSLMLLAIALKLSYGLFIEPDDMFVLEVVQ
jgi:uncharacterized membrane protein YfcA